MAQTNMAEQKDALTKLCSLDDLDEEEGFCAGINGIDYAVFKVGELVFVIADMCSHGPGNLSEGYVEGFEVECPFHQGKFDLRTGMPTAPPCEAPVAIWTPVIQDGEIFIDVSSPSNM